MRNSFLAGLLCWYCSVLGAQTAPLSSGSPEALDMRQRISAQRATIEAAFLTKQQECSERFAVSDCLIQARRERRVALDALRQQDIRLNDMDRQTKAAAALDRIQDNQSPERAREFELKRLQAVQSAQERQLRSDEKKAQVGKPGASVVTGTRAAKSALSPDETLLQQQRYADKLQQAQQHKADKLRSLKESGATSAKPLPLPAEISR